MCFVQYSGVIRLFKAHRLSSKFINVVLVCSSVNLMIVMVRFSSILRCLMDRMLYRLLWYHRQRIAERPGDLFRDDMLYSHIKVSLHRFLQSAQLSGLPILY